MSSRIEEDLRVNAGTGNNENRRENEQNRDEQHQHHTTHTENEEIPEYLRPVHDDWFGEAAAPLLFRSVNLESWDICRRLLSDLEREIVTKDLMYVDMYGYSALHYACWWNSAPLELAEKILNQSPRDYPCLRNRKGRTPLHLAAWRGRDELVELLANQCPEAASVLDRTGKSPLLDACTRNRSKRVLQALIAADPSQLLQNLENGNIYNANKNRTPVLTLFRISHGFISAPYRTRYSRPEERQLFNEKVAMMLAAEKSALNLTVVNPSPCLSSVSSSPTSSVLCTDNISNIACLDDKVFQNDTWSTVCAAIESPSCPFAYVRQLLEGIDSQQMAGYRDESGNTLLHIAIKARPFDFESFYRCDRCNTVSRVHPVQCKNGSDAGGSPAVRDRLHFNKDPDKPHWGVRCQNPACQDGSRWRSRRRMFLHYVSVEVVCKETEMVRYMLERNPELARVTDLSGRLPIELALEGGMTWHGGIRELALSHPSCLSQLDNITNLYPFLLAASSANIANSAITDDSKKRQHLDVPTARPSKKKKKLSDDTNQNNTNNNGHHGSIETGSQASNDGKPCNVSDADTIGTIFHLLRERPDLVKPAVL